jgi:hypothetical protein
VLVPNDSKEKGHVLVLLIMEFGQTKDGGESEKQKHGVQQDKSRNA